MPAFVQSTSATVHSGSSLAKAFTSNNTAGNTLVAAVGVWKSGGGFNDPTISDSQGNTWVKLLDTPRSRLTSAAYLFVAYNCKSGANTVTANDGISCDIDMAIHEYSGVATVTARDQIAGGMTESGSSILAGTFTTQKANEIIFSFCYDQQHGVQTFTPTAGWTARQQTANSNGESLASFDRIVSSVGTFTNTIGVSGGVSQGLHAIIASFADTPTTDNLVQSARNTANSTSVAVTFGTPNVAGNLLLLAVGRFASTTINSTPTVSDSKGNVWILVSSSNLCQSVGHGQSQSHLFACASAKAGANIVTVTASGVQNLQAIALEYLPAVITNFAQASNIGGSPVSTGNVSATGTFAFAIGYNQSSNCGIYSDVSGTGWRQRVYQSQTSGTTLTVYDQILNSVPATIEQTLTLSTTSNGLHVIMTATNPPTPPPPPLAPCVPVDGGGNLTGGTYVQDLSLFILPETALYTNPILPGAITTSELNNEGRRTIILDFNNGDGLYARDLGTVFEWPTNNGIQVLVWQPSIIPMPEATYSRATDWDDAGVSGAKFIQGVIVEAFSFGNSKTFFLQDSDTLALHSLNECPVTFAKQQEVAFSCAPFIAHSARLISSDGVEWRIWKSRIIAQPFPELTMNWQTELTSLGMTGWAHVREMNLAYLSTTPVTLTLSFDSIAPIIITLLSTSGAQAKTKITVPPNKWKLIGFQASSATAFRIFQGDIELKLREWGAQGPYGVVKPFGGSSSAGATV